MPRDPRAFVWDARQSIAHLRSFIDDKTWHDDEGDVLLDLLFQRGPNGLDRGGSGLATPCPNAIVIV